jgi:hypothetical protein
MSFLALNRKINGAASASTPPTLKPNLERFFMLDQKYGRYHRMSHHTAEGRSEHPALQFDVAQHALDRLGRTRIARPLAVTCLRRHTPTVP